MLHKIKKFPGLVTLQASLKTHQNFLLTLNFSFQTVLESNSRDPVQGPLGDDEFELWDYSQMLRNQQRYKWSNGTVCKPSCIPILFILILIVLVVLLPLLDTNEKISGRNGTIGWNCLDECK